MEWIASTVFSVACVVLGVMCLRRGRILAAVLIVPGLLNFVAPLVRAKIDLPAASQG